MQLLKALCEIQAPSGNEAEMTNFLLQYINKQKKEWKVEPRIYSGEDFQDCLVLSFGKPRTAVFAHLDSVGFTVRYHNQLVPIGSPDLANGYHLTGNDSLGPIDCELRVDEHNYLTHNFARSIDRGTDLVYKCNFRDRSDYIQSSYLDNRLGVYATLKLAETLENGVIVYSCGEEHGGGTVPFLTKFLYEKLKIRQALVADITWITDGIQPGQGVVISLRDRLIPRKKYIYQILEIAHHSGIPFQMEVEASGSSDAREINASPYPVDWCFIGAAEEYVHSPDEQVHKNDILSMIQIYRVLMEHL